MVGTYTLSKFHINTNTTVEFISRWKTCCSPKTIFFIVTSTQALIFLPMKIAPKNNWWCIHSLGIQVAKGLGRDCAVSQDLPGFIPRYTDIPRTERSTKGIHSTSLHFPFISKFYNCLRACLSEWKCVSIFIVLIIFTFAKNV